MFMDEVIGMTSGYGCGKQRKSGTVDYLLNQSSDKPSITTTGGEAKLHRQLRFLLTSFLAFRSSPTNLPATDLRNKELSKGQEIDKRTWLKSVLCSILWLEGFLSAICLSLLSLLLAKIRRTVVSCFPCSRQLVLDRSDRVFIIWSKRIRTFACRYQKPMLYHLAILHRPILDGRNRKRGKGEAGLKERAEPCKDAGI
ncbi:hypothetical protein BC332_32824 [Capsicum chinense]|nr:hypothetical protein BC332_32824 [Capsicum chinense]